MALQASGLGRWPLLGVVALAGCATGPERRAPAPAPPPRAAPRAAVTVTARITPVRVVRRTRTLAAARCRDLVRFFDAVQEVASVRTDWATTTASRPGGSGGGGGSVRVTVEPSYTITMPRWNNLAARPARERAAWGTVYDALVIHEQGHIDIFLEELDRLNAALASTSEPSVTATLSEIDARLVAFLATLHTRQAQYDGRTQHGINQGAILKCP